MSANKPVYEVRFSEKQEVDRKRDLIDWYLEWLGSQMNGEIIAHRTRLIKEGVSPVMSYDEFCDETTTTFAGKKTGVVIAMGYDSGGFRVRIGSFFEPRKAWSRGMTSDKVNEIYELLAGVTDFLCDKQQGLRHRLERQELD